MGWVKGLEPSTLGTTIRCSNQLSYTHHILFCQQESAYREGFASLRYCLSNPWPVPDQNLGTPGGIRTPGLLLRRQLLYPAELLAHINSGDPKTIKKWSG